MSTATPFRFLLIFVISIIIQLTYAANILFINMYNSKSHALSMMPLAKSLANRGNRVAMFSIMVNSMNELDGGVENIEARMPIEKVQQSLTILGSVVWEWDFQPYRLSRAYTQAEFYYISLDDLDEDWQSFMSRLKTVRDLIIEWFSMGVLGAKTLQNGIRMIGVDEQLSDLVAPVQHFNYKCVAILPADLRRKKPVRSEGAEDFPIVDAKPLPEDVEKFVSSPNSRGTIYVAFGSMADWSNAPSHVIKSFVEAFNALDAYRIIWSSKAKPPEGLKDHIKILSWAPQSSILLHKRTKLFFTHAGLKSIRESICAKVPMLAIPFFADQAKNAYLCRAAGFARIIHKRKVNASVLLESIEDMLNNGSYQRRISKVNKLCMESILAPLRKETFWVERILRSKAPYVTYPIKGAQMPLMQYFGLDIASFLVVIIIVLLK
ncbi:UDP-glucuronosyltransferase [Toxocara canis]|uniref:UDP-glucuronosyltransferase n=1 Tax=Toxocara canis TaxID=6265 RepID=A0A0B2UUI0_TOXCA|nr:UDP-glucuronosyltransferase [Toxocara canis]